LTKLEVDLIIRVWGYDIVAAKTGMLRDRDIVTF